MIKLEDLEQRYSKYWWGKEQERVYTEVCKEPFKLLIFTILSQNTSSENTYRTYKALSSKFFVSPKTLAKIEERKLAVTIKAGGLHNIKAARIKACSQYISKKSVSSKIFLLPVSKMREELKKIPGVGAKTADVLLSNIHSPKEALAIDTHFRRLALRLGLVEKSAAYENIQKALANFIPWHAIPKRKHKRFVTLLWLLAKHTCRALTPKCNDCILKSICKLRNKKVLVEILR